MSVLGYVSKLETFATLDGGGIRVAVFMQGCPLRCAYCHNPETQSLFDAPNEVRDTALTEGESVFVTPSKGTKNHRITVYTAEKLAARILRYKTYIKKGGVTFTGGEPLLQSDFLIKTANILKRENINIALDTSCSVINDSVKSLFALCDLIIADLKFPTDALYKKYAGGSLVNVAETLLYLKSIGKKILLRTVVIPTVNDNINSIDAYADFLINNDLLKAISKYELLPFHTMGFSKYDDFGMENKLKGVSALNENTLNKLQKHLNSKLNLQ